jgi:hypothetical protein
MLCRPTYVPRKTLFPDRPCEQVQRRATKVLAAIGNIPERAMAGQ